jgi:nitroreductase
MFTQLIKNNRTKRIYTGEAVSFSVLRELIEDCRFSASTVNKQYIRYILINDETLCREIFNLTNLPTTHKVDVKNKPGAFVVMVIDRNLKLPENLLYYNVGIATANLTLSATSKGYGCVTLLSTDLEKLAGVISLDGEKKAVSIIAVGKSDQVVVTEDIEEGDTAYYKRQETIHVVPKLTTKALILKEI